MKSLVELNGITYKHKGRPIVVVCIDGGDPTYFEHGIANGILPNVERFQQTGFGVIAEGSMPSLTNPNNMSIVTGSPPAVHGISGNYFLDPDTGDAVMMNDPVHLRADTILECFSRAGGKSRSNHRKGQTEKTARKRSGLRSWIDGIFRREIGPVLCREQWNSKCG